ncbi:hypothetical protein [Miniphocaeibacter halophilus]|uniref:Uncharacterized protein n=1 Tax=Miniphocaeibacter halophilus TaxID=2931922 RepID=A0AC61MXR4_9FIRM|nr:hypothetical protein [Miniphocaeibacter halophilus]QQK07373.1 hypothetical protein JFY71_08615 [Miniphocaeibacter halophilus]
MKKKLLVMVMIGMLTLTFTGCKVEKGKPEDISEAEKQIEEMDNEIEEEMDESE